MRNSVVQLKKQKQQVKENLSVSDIKPKTFAQGQMINAYLEGQHVLAKGSAGTGKTFIASYLGLRDLFQKEKQKIIFVRSIVPTRDVGFLPGTLEEKVSVYLQPYKDAVNQLCECGTAWETLFKKNHIQFLPTSYIRGITIDNAVIIVDEYQNLTQHELYSVLTRAGDNTQIILCGDTRQVDLNSRKEQDCCNWMDKIANRMPSWIDTVNFFPEDIVRSGFVGDLIKVAEDL